MTRSPQSPTGKFQTSEYDAGATSAAFVLATATHNTFLHEAPDGSIWLSDDHGLRRVTTPAGGKRNNDGAQFGDFTFAPDGSLWAVSDQGTNSGSTAFGTALSNVPLPQAQEHDFSIVAADD